MSLDGRLLARAKDRLDEIKRSREAEYARRQAQVYAKSPRVRELDSEIRGTMIDTIGFALSSGSDPTAAIEDIRADNLFLQAERAEEIAAAGFPFGYLDGGYMCEKCHDTGFIGTNPCACLMDLYTKEQSAALSSLFKLGSEAFDNFDLTWYADVPDPATGVSPRRHMEFVYENCLNYALNFGKKSVNLFLTGAPGLGKTFLSACIARVVSEKGFSVVYDTASSVFSKFETEKFSRGEGADTARGELKRYMDCDLLIVDDLGTEMVTAFTVTALYELVNTRLFTGKKTVINSNLSLDDLRTRYTPQIVSRLAGEYQVLGFYGRDIRLQKKAF